MKAEHVASGWRRAAWRLSGWPLLLAAAILTWAHGAAALPPAHDFAADARQMKDRQVPMLVLYSRDGCGWCTQVRRSFLEPLLADPQSADRVLIRQVDVDRRIAIADFSGKTSTHRDFARLRRVSLTPTIEVLGPDGKPLAEAIVGLGIPDFYATYIDRAIDAGLARMRRNVP